MWYMPTFAPLHHSLHSCRYTSSIPYVPTFSLQKYKNYAKHTNHIPRYTRRECDKQFYGQHFRLHTNLNSIEIYPPQQDWRILMMTPHSSLVMPGGGWRLGRSSMVPALRESLKRMGKDQVDLWQVNTWKHVATRSNTPLRIKWFGVV